MGTVTGVLADSLNWAGISEDRFNEQLAACSDEAERSALITQTLTDIYGEAGEAYREVNENLVEYRESQARANETAADAGNALLPIVTLATNIGTAILQWALPGLQKFSDFLTGPAISNGLPGFIAAVTTGFNSMLSGVDFAGMATRLGEKTTSLIEGLLPAVANGLSGLVTSIGSLLTTLLPVLLQNSMNFWNAILAQIPTILPVLLGAISTLVMQIVGMLPTLGPMITQGVTMLVQMIADILPTLIPMISDAAIALLMAIVDAVPGIVDSLVPAVLQLIDSVVQLLPTLIPELMTAALYLFDAICQAIPQILPPLLSAALSLIMSLLTYLPTHWGNLISVAKSLFMAIVSAVPQIVGSLLSAVGSLLTQAASKVSGFASQMATAAKDMVRGMVQGIRDAGGEVWNAIKNVCSNSLNTILEFFGINSPSRVMRETFGFVGEGMVWGLEDKAANVVDSMRSIASSTLEAASFTASPTLSFAGVGSAASNVSATSTSSLTKQDVYEAVGAAVADAMGAQGDIVLKIGEREFGRAVRKVV